MKFTNKNKKWEFDDWELDVLGIGNDRSNLFHLNKYFGLIKKYHKKIDGDIAEFGVYNGKTLLATALFLKKINSKKKIYAFDSFKGLKNFSDNDKFSLFKKQLKKKIISKKNFNDHNKLLNYKRFLGTKKINPSNVSGSLNFSNSNLQLLKKKIIFLNLDNIKIVKGDFSKTLKKKLPFKKLMCANLDCDLWEAYSTIFYYLNKYFVKKSFIYLDEYYSLKFPGPRLAVNSFIHKNKNFRLYKFHKKFSFPRYFLFKSK